MKIGVISDTHNFLDPVVPKLFAGVDHILHGGDIGLPKLLLDLEQIAPVTAVAGNTDDSAFRYPLTEVIELSGINSSCTTSSRQLGRANPREPSLSATAREWWCLAIRTSLSPRSPAASSI